jgi:hypothetical protein
VKVISEELKEKGLLTVKEIKNWYENYVYSR